MLVKCGVQGSILNPMVRSQSFIEPSWVFPFSKVAGPLVGQALATQFPPRAGRVRENGDLWEDIKMPIFLLLQGAGKNLLASTLTVGT